MGQAKNFTREQLQQAIDDGLTQKEAGARFGCNPQTVRRWARRLGITWPHFGHFLPRQRLEVFGEWLSCREIADRYGLRHSTVCWRWRHGWRGADLAAPARCDTLPRDHYEAPYSAHEWREIAGYAEERGIKTAAATFGVPYGAVTAAMRGEDHRLG